MIHLHSAPAFGFEWQGCNASFTRQVAKGNYFNFNGNEAKTAYLAANFFKILGVVCPLVGAVRMIEALSSNDKNKTMHFLRGLGELLGCGIFILGVDMVVTIHRASQMPKYGLRFI